MKYHKGPQIKTFALCVAAALLAACETLPKADVIESNGCGVLQWNTGWVKANVTEIEWTGVCNSGLISGVGELRAKTKSGGKITYQGRAEYGKFQTQASELATLVLLDEKYVGQFMMGGFYNGKFYKNNQIAAEGYFSDWSLSRGTAYLTNGNRITGTFNNPMGKISSDGAGVAYGTYETASGQPIWWIVDEKKITTLEKYTEKLREKRLAEKKNIDEQIAKAEQNAIEAEKNYNASVKNTLGALANIAVESGAAVAQRKAELRQQREQQVAGTVANKDSSSNSDRSNYEAQKSDSEAEFNAKVKDRPCYPEFIDWKKRWAPNVGYDFFLFGMNDEINVLLGQMTTRENSRKQYQDYIKEIANILKKRVENKWLPDGQLSQCRDYYRLNYMRNIIPLAPFIKNYGLRSIDDINRTRKEIIGY